MSWGTQQLSVGYKVNFVGSTTGFTSQASTKSDGSYNTGAVLPPDTYTVSLLGTSADNVESQTITVAAGQTINDIDFDLSQSTGLVEGSLSVNGSLTGAHVQFCSPAPASCPDSTNTTYQLGSPFSIPVLPGNYRMYVANYQDILAGIVPITVSAGQIDNDSSLQFQLNLGTISGTILWGNQVTSLNGKYEMKAVGETTGFTTYQSLKNDGSYNTGPILPADTYTVTVVDGPGADQLESQIVTVAAGQTINDIDFDLSQSTGLVEGSLSVNGSLAGAHVQFCAPAPASCPDSVNTTYQLGSPFSIPVLPGNYRMYVATYQNIPAGTVPITVTAGQINSDSSLQLQLNLGTGTGTVSWGTQQPSVMYKVSFVGNSTGFTSQASTNSEGSYTTTAVLPPDTYTVTLTGPGADDVGSQTVTVLGGDTKTVNFDLSLTTGLVKGGLTINGVASIGYVQFCAASPAPCPAPLVSSNGPIYPVGTDGFTVPALPGNYQVHVTTVAGVDVCTESITVNIGQINDLSNCEYPPPTPTPTPSSYDLNGTVYVDTNSDGKQDNSETGYNGATVTISGDGTGTTTTGSDGSYSFPNLAPGSYTVALTLPNGYVATTNKSVIIPLTSDTTQNFGIVQATTTLTPLKDSFIQHNGQDSNEGASPFLELSVEGKERALIQFNQSQIQAAIGDDPSYTATLQLTIVSNNNKWSTGRQIDVNRMEQSWTEGNGSRNYNGDRGTGAGVTWNCATDSNIANQGTDCSGSTAWDMIDQGSWPYAQTPTATTTITNNQSGTVSFNVTPDIQSFINGTVNDGWIVKKDDETADGDIQFGSRESIYAPKLIITRQ